jgi:hypothetical protein
VPSRMEGEVVVVVELEEEVVEVAVRMLIV